LRLRETATELRSFLASLAAEPDRLEQIEGELDRIAEAKRRFRCSSYEELLARAAEAQTELEALEDGADPVAAAAKALEEAERRVGQLASALRESRRSAAEAFADAVAAELEGIGMGEGEFRVELTEREPSSTGGDGVAFLIRPNAGLPFAPVAETASGGELSRVALAIAVVGGGETMVFDEIDAGIGGRVAEVVGRKLQQLAARNQVICVTHLPQIASFGNTHFYVWKEDAAGHTRARIRRLDDPEERVGEIARMLGGEKVSASAVAHARELIAASVAP
jgi:DNA repair protein RecN (Recombination protein N)